MSAEQLIALEAAQAELGTLYVVARGFTALHTRAEAELLPQLASLASRLRRLVRTSDLTDNEIDAAAREISALRTRWRAELEEVHASTVYQRALAAVAADRQDEIASVIPQVLAGLHLVRPAPPLYFPVSPSSGRRRPGASPFLSAAECADSILHIVTDGYEPESGGNEWWERELPSIGCADSAAALETPIMLRVDASDVHVAVFGVGDDPGFRIFSPQMRAPFSIVLEADATDEWWEAYQDSYRTFRDALQRELAARGHRATIRPS